MALPMIIVHGGAGKWKDERIPIGLEEVEKAARTGFAVLENGGTALDAAEACTVYMESCGNLNAGLGGRYNVDGVRELDAKTCRRHFTCSLALGEECDQRERQRNRENDDAGR